MYAKITTIYITVRDVRLVIVRIVFGTCADKTDADRGINIINCLPNILLINPTLFCHMYFSNGSFYD
jgi:hypothetical protein